MSDNFSQRLRWLIDVKAEGKQAMFAKQAEITPAGVHAYLHGRLPQAEQLINIHKYFHVNIDWLLTGEGVPFPTEDSGSDSSPKETLKPSQAIDPMILELTIEVLEEWLDKENRVMTPDKKAAAIRILYDVAIDAGQDAKRRIAGVLKLMAT